MLVNVFGLRPGRATVDLDLGIALESWDQFRALKQALTTSGLFVSVPKSEQRLIYSDWPNNVEIPVDLIPFGGVASTDDMLAWPPRGDIIMTVASFAEALASAVLLKIEDGLLVRVASIPGLTILKFVAWADRGKQNSKDATDLYRLLVSYADAGNLERLYGQELALLEAAGFDVEIAGARLLGQDVARVCHPSTTKRIRALLLSEQTTDGLTAQIIQASCSDEQDSEAITRLLDSFRQGFLG